jgi:L,D-transpeptidase YcbB
VVKKLVLSSACLLALASTPAFAQLQCEQLATALADSANQAAQAAAEPLDVRVPYDLKRGQSSTLLPMVREALSLPAAGGFDASLQKAIKDRQDALGFTATGVLDAHTFLNVVPLSPQYQAKVAEATAAQCHRVNEDLAKTMPAKFIEVNVASQTLVAYEFDASGQAVEVLRSRVVAGAPKTQTPLDDFKLWGLKFNPGWTPTSNILSRNVVKSGSVNKRWLASHQMHITDASGNTVASSNVTASNWKQFRYHQPAGPAAALGVLKFETSSGQNIYMHDTPEKEKFDWNVRLASSGCVRVQEIEQLARWAFDALEENSTASNAFDKYQETVKNGVKRLPKSIPVYLTYRQVDFSEQNEPVFYADGYNRSGFRVSLEQ